MPRRENMGNMLATANLGLITARSNKSQQPDHFFCSRFVSEAKSGESTTQSCLFPLYLTPGVNELSFAGQRTHGFHQEFLQRLSASVGLKQASGSGLPAGFEAEDIFHYAYAVFHSPGYRSRYAELLKIDFPRLPLTGRLELFRALSRCGGELTALHLLESPMLEQSITEFVGGRNPEVERISWSRNTVWVDKAQASGFCGVPEKVWNFHIGGYQVCEKWLKDRKGRRLSKEDVAHYQKIVVAIVETIRVMEEIDEVIEQHGGWPGAFVANQTHLDRPSAGLLKVADRREDYGHKA